MNLPESDRKYLSSLIEARLLEHTSQLAFSSETFQLEAARLYGKLSMPLRQSISGFRFDSNEDNVLLIRNIPLGEVPLTPNFGNQLDIHKTVGLPELILSMVTNGGLGSIIAYRQQEEGDIYNNIMPLQGHETHQSYGSFNSFLEFHTELAFHPYLPNWVCLLCLRQDPLKQAETIFSPLTKIMKELRSVLNEMQMSLLTDPLFSTEEDEVFRRGDSPRVLVPILFGSSVSPLMRSDTLYMRGTSSETQHLVDMLNETIRQNKQSIKLEMGDLLIIDNLRAAHARSTFSPFFDGYDRWLKRAYAIRELNAIPDRDQANPRVIRTEI